MKVGLLFQKQFFSLTFIFKKDIWKKLARFNHREIYI